MSALLCHLLERFWCRWRGHDWERWDYTVRDPDRSGLRFRGLHCRRCWSARLDIEGAG